MQPAQVAKVIQRFQELVRLSTLITTHTTNVPLGYAWADDAGNVSEPMTTMVTPDEADCRAWIVQAGTALAEVFPESHPARVDWDAIVRAKADGFINPYLDRLRGIFNGGAELVRKGYVGSLIESIKAETLGELLDLADGHLAQGDLVAAVSLTGGVLETHLRHLVDRNNLVVDGHGSIEKYNNLIAQERKTGNEIYSLGDQKQITAWGDARNIADHSPLSFTKSREEVSLMLQGIRNFLARVP